MQDEVNTKVVAIMIKGGKILSRGAEKGAGQVRAEIKGAEAIAAAPKTYRGKQSIKHLMSQNAAISNIEVTDGNIKSFERTASKYGLDFALAEHLRENRPAILSSSRGRDVDVHDRRLQGVLCQSCKQKERPVHSAQAGSGESPEQGTAQRESQGQDQGAGCGAVNKPDVKKLILLNLPYVFAFYFADKIAAVFRLASGTEFIDKLTNGFAVLGIAFANPLPSFIPSICSSV